MAKKKVGVGVRRNLPIEKNIDNIFTQLKDTMINHMDKEKAIKLLYWMNDWGADYLKNEKTFDYRDLIRYKRGSIVEADLGFKVGSEQGGLHYCIVLDNRNSKDNRVLMVVPLESLPDNKSPESVDEDYEVFLGAGLFKEDIEKQKKQIEKLKSKIISMEEKGENTVKQKGILGYLEKELLKLQKGSVAQIAQICALSKMRIYTPKHMGDMFCSFQLDDDIMNEIEKKIAKIYLNKKYHELE